MSVDDTQNWRMWQTAYGNSPLMQSPLGTEKTILSIQRQDLLDFHRAKYWGGNTVVVVEGPVNHDAIVSQLKKEFTLPSGNKEAVSFPSYSGGYYASPEGGRGVRVKLGFNGSGQDSPDVQATYSMLADILAGGKDSILYRTLRSKQSLVYNVSCDNSSALRLLDISFNTFAENVKPCLEIISSTLNDLMVGVDLELIQRKKAAASLAYRISSTHSKRGVYDMAHFLLMEGKVPPRDYDTRRYLSVTPEAIQASIGRMLEKPPTLVVAGNTSHVPAYEDVCQMFSAANRPASAATVPSLGNTPR